MPDHIHGLVGCVDGTSVANVIRGFKSAVSSEWNGAGPLWQRGYYEHIVRSEWALGQICEYIWSNPESWPNEPPLRLDDGEAPLRERVTDVRGRGDRSDL